MRVELTTAVFDADEHVEDVLTLLKRFAAGRHRWVVEPTQVKAVESFLDRHYPTLAASYKDLARQSARQRAYSTPGAPAPLRVSADDFADYMADLERPAVVMVENDASDGGFIKAIACVFKDGVIVTAIENEWLVIDHGGGTAGLFRRASDKHSRFRRVSRVAVVLDSDRRLPGDPPDKHADIERLRADGIKVHVLRLREIENYIPDKVLRELPRQVKPLPKVAALGRLTKEQRGHYDMKSGFKNGVVPPEQRPLYDGVPQDVINDLADGFGRKVIETFLEHAAELTEEDFRTDVGPDAPEELRAMLEMLREIV